MMKLSGTATETIPAFDGTIPAGTPVLVTETRSGKWRIRACGLVVTRSTFAAVARVVEPA